MYRLVTTSLPLAPLCISTARASSDFLLMICWDLEKGDVRLNISQEATPPAPGVWGSVTPNRRISRRVGAGLAGINLVSCRSKTSRPGSSLNQCNNISYGGPNAIYIPLQNLKTTSSTTTTPPAAYRINLRVIDCISSLVIDAEGTLPVLTPLPYIKSPQGEARALS
jgi:hypothetical protein